VVVVVVAVEVFVIVVVVFVIVVVVVVGVVATNDKLAKTIGEVCSKELLMVVFQTL